MLRVAAGVDQPSAPVAAVVIAEVDEAVVGGRALPVRGPRPDVGPFLEQDAVKSFDVAVGLWSA